MAAERCVAALREAFRNPCDTCEESNIVTWKLATNRVFMKRMDMHTHTQAHVHPHAYTRIHTPHTKCQPPAVFPDLSRLVLVGRPRRVVAVAVENFRGLKSHNRSNRPRRSLLHVDMVWVGLAAKTPNLSVSLVSLDPNPKPKL